MNQFFDPKENTMPQTAPENVTQAAPAEPVTSRQVEAIPLADSADNGTQGSFVPEFYGSYGDAVGQAVPSVPAPEPEPEVSLPQTFQPDDGFEDLQLPDDLPPVPTPTTSGKVQKSMGYEKTVKLENARRADRNEKPIHEEIKTGQRPVAAPKNRGHEGIASGTAHVSGGLPELRDDQMYVALTNRELRLLNSRRFRGLGVLATLCLSVIAAFCIWSYAHSFADPLVGRWKGNVESANIPIEAIQSINAESMDSTWEFGSSGSLYLNLVVNETPVSLSGKYSEKTAENGEPYLEMVLSNPTDGNAYSFNMYYTVTGSVLQFNDMEGLGMEIDLTKE